MKKLVLSLAILATIFTSCSTDDETTTGRTPVTGEITGDISANKTYPYGNYTLRGIVKIQSGVTVTFDATIKNTGNVADNYTITVPNVPAGWTVEIFEKDGNGYCTTTKVTNSGNIAAGAAKSFCVTVTPPAGTPAGDTKNIQMNIGIYLQGFKIMELLIQKY